MKKIVRIRPILLFILVFDRFFFLLGRMDATGQYDDGTLIETPITFNNIDIKNNFEISINEYKHSESFYLLECYFGRLYLLNQDTLEYTKLTELAKMKFIE